MKIRSSLYALALAAVASQAAISYDPVTPGATESAKKLYNFLATNYGVKTVSGIQTGDLNTSATLKEQEDLKAVYDVAGKYPALVGFDFLFANGIKASVEWNKQYTAKTIALATELWKAGGIPAFSWHWKDPSHTVDAFYASQKSAGKDKDGKDNPFTTFDFSQGFKSGTTDWDDTTTTYKKIIEDIDEISVLFKTLQDSGVAAIFRPLHEVGGDWFWWSTQEGKEYAALYRLVYTRLTETKGIKNLVWVWNPQRTIFTQKDWNPGASYYDVIGVDIYNPAYNYKSNADAYKEMVTNYSTDKIFTLSENGPIPDASLMHADGAVWSWNMPWYESWGGKFVSQTKNTVWEANLASPCVITLDKMPGWDKYSTKTTQEASCTVGYELGKLDTAIEVVEVDVDTTKGNGWLKVVVNNMHNVIVDGDTTVPAAANIYIQPTADLTGSKTASLTVYNTSTSGVWMSMAELTDGDWKWQMPPKGCWVNPGDSTLCTMDVSKMSMDKVAKIYIMVATDGYSGTLYFDNFKTDVATIASFDKASDLFTREQAGALAYVKTIALVGGAGNGTEKVYQTLASFSHYSVQGSHLLVSMAKSEKVSLDLYDMQGQRVASLHQGELTSGTHSFDLSRFTKGLYLVRTTGALGSSSQTLLLK